MRCPPPPYNHRRDNFCPGYPIANLARRRTEEFEEAIAFSKSCKTHAVGAASGRDFKAFTGHYRGETPLPHFEFYTIYSKCGYPEEFKLPTCPVKALDDMLGRYQKACMKNR